MTTTRTMPYTDERTGATCNCGHTGQHTSRGASIPHADTCPVRVARAAAVMEAARMRAQEEMAHKAAREEAQKNREAACPGHAWTWLSHEEMECSRCGAIKFVMDCD